MKTEKIKSICVTAVFAAIICIMAPFSIPLQTLVPISLATLAIYLTAGLLDWKNSVSAVVVYILLGAVGLPVFSSFTGGLQKLVGVTGGYIIGYIPLALIVSLMCGKIKGKWVYPVSMIIGTVVLYAIGTAWFMFQTKTAFAAAMASCVIPFLPGDAVKIAAASAVSIPLRTRLEKFISK
ncbi:MAG: biotin transporter BioY [Acutalibacteraceae bacterium]